jgi:GTP-dependent phosphoenolpyruvate carboxykinase
VDKESDALAEVEWMLLRMLEQAIDVATIIGVVPTAEEALICALAEVDRMIARHRTIQ